MVMIFSILFMKTCVVKILYMVKILPLCSMTNELNRLLTFVFVSWFSWTCILKNPFLDEHSWSSLTYLVSSVLLMSVCPFLFVVGHTCSVKTNFKLSYNLFPKTMFKDRNSKLNHQIKNSLKTIYLTHIIFSTIDLVSPSKSESLEFSGWTFFVFISGSVVTSLDHHSILLIFSRFITMHLWINSWIWMHSIKWGLGWELKNFIVGLWIE